MHDNRGRKREGIFVRIHDKEYTGNSYILKQISMQKYYYSPKSGKTLARQIRMTKKLSPTEAHLIVKDYVKIKEGKHKYFGTVNALTAERNISRNVPSKLLTKFHRQWKELHPKETIDYKVNIFLERSHLRKYRKLPLDPEYEQFVKQYAR